MKPRITLFPDGGEVFMAMHIDGRLCGLWRGPMIQCAGEVLKELVFRDLAEVVCVGKRAEEAWEGIKTATEVLAST